MSEFINTINQLGDSVVLANIINRSITEFKDDVITTIGKEAFCGCNKLLTIDLPNVTNVNGSCFASCTTLRDVNLPNVTTIGSSAFYKCQKISKLELPNVTSIDNASFRNCSALTKLVLRSNTLCTLVNTYAFNTTPIASGTGFIYVNDNLVNDYKIATNWSTFANQIKPISELGG